MILLWLKQRPALQLGQPWCLSKEPHPLWYYKYIYVTLQYATVSIKKESTRVFLFLLCSTREMGWLLSYCSSIRNAPDDYLYTKKAARMWNKGSFTIIYFIPFRNDCYTYSKLSSKSRSWWSAQRPFELWFFISTHFVLCLPFSYFQALFRLHHKVIGYFRFFLPLKNLRLNSFHIFPYS